MRLLGLVALLGTIGGASAQMLVFTTKVHLECPVQMSAIAQTKDLGFQSVALRNESKKTVDTVRLMVSLTTEAGEEVVEKADFLVNLAPGEKKRIDIGLGRVPELTRKAHQSHRPTVHAVLFVDSAGFTDGTRWSGEEPAINDPVRPPSSK